jgi:cysteine desulfurase / selenocysteine lyase
MASPSCDDFRFDAEDCQVIYLDNAATSFPKPPEVYDFVDHFYRSYGVNPGRSGFDLAVEAGRLVDLARKRVAAFFGAKDPNRVVFGLNATDALNLALFGLLAPGDHVITTKLDHNSSLRPLYHLRQQGVEVDFVDFDGRGFIDPDDVVGRIRPKTRVVMINHASNVLGTVQPVEAIGAACRERGAHLVLDISQTAGVVPIDMDRLGADVICFTGHKGLQAPMGIGGMAVREGVEIRHTRAGGTGVRSQDKLHLSDYPYRLETGTPNLPGIAGLYAGLGWIQKRGLETLRAEEHRLWQLLRDELAGIEGVTLYGQESIEAHIAVLAFNIAGWGPGAVGDLLDVDHGVACRTGLHCAPLVHQSLGTDVKGGAVRLSLGVFTTEADVRAASSAVAAIAEQSSTERS